MTLRFSIVEEEEGTTETLTSYVIDEVQTMEIVLPNLAYEYEREAIIDEFGVLGVSYGVDEGRDDVTLRFHFSEEPEMLF